MLYVRPESRQRHVVSELLATSEPAVIPHVLPFFFTGPPRSEADIQMLAALTAQLSLPELITLDQRVRELWRMYITPVDSQVASEQRGIDAVVMLGLLSFAPSGYVRESAVEQLARFDDGRELPYLLLRLVDWVPQVRDAASRVLAPRIRVENIERFVANLPLITHVRRRVPRLKTSALDELLAAPEARPLLLHAMNTGSVPMQRAAFEILAEHPAADVVIAATNAADTVLRSRALRLIVSTLPHDDAAVLGEKLAHDRAPAIRRDALTILATFAPDRARTLLPAALFDRSRGVREVARFMLRHDAPDFGAMYRNALAAAVSPKDLPTLIAALSEVGERSDAQIVLPYLRHASASVRRVTVRALRQLGGNHFLPQLVPLLADPSRAVSAAARDVLHPRGHNLEDAQLWEIFTTAGLRHVRLNTLSVIAALPKWQSIRRLIDAVRDDDDLIAAVAQKRIGRWIAQYNRSTVAPSAAQIGEVASALEKSKNELPARVAREIEFSLQAFR